ncbi:hypothetical protein R0K04_30480, partial [Pseudoalteromonas sp. SIMBA_153]
MAQKLADDPNFKFESEDNNYSPNTGNPNVKEETADTYTFGITVSFEFLDGFNLAGDYDDIA